MPLRPYKRGSTWWVRGRVDYNGRPVSRAYRCSTRASTEAGARDWIREEEQRVIRGFLLGEDKDTLTFSQAVVLYPAKPAEAKFLIKVVLKIGDTKLSDVTPQMVRDICPQIYPVAATDTWKRQVLTPVSAVINHAHQLGHCPPIRIKGFSAQDRIDQDRRRGKLSRQPRPAGSWDWLQKVQPHCNPYVAAALEFMFETGTRIGQVVAIRPTDLDLAGARVRVIAQKGHAEQWVAISPQMVASLTGLKARRPREARSARRLPPRVFGYATRSGFRSALKRACKDASAPYLTPHEAGRHGFYTELRVRQGLDPVTVAQAGRWSDPTLPDRRYAHSESEDRDMRAAIRNTATEGKSRLKVTR